MHKITFKKCNPAAKKFKNMDEDYGYGMMVEYDMCSNWTNILDAKRVVMDYLCRK